MPKCSEIVIDNHTFIISDKPMNGDMVTFPR